jgi:Co/Zn/Cd efflux system component
MLHLLYDIGASAAVLAAGAVIWATGWHIIDALLGIVLGPLTIYSIKHIEEHADLGHGHEHAHDHHHHH